MKNFWIVICICSIGVLIGVIVFAGGAYIQHMDEEKVVDVFQSLESDSIQQMETTLTPSLVILPSQKEEEEEIQLLFGGDVYFSDTFLGAYDTEGINGILDTNVLELMIESDITMVNQ